MSDFGDSEPDDSYDVETVLDAFQVAKRVHEERVAEGEALIEWDDLDPEMREMAVRVFVRVIAWLHRQGAVRGV